MIITNESAKGGQAVYFSNGQRHKCERDPYFFKALLQENKKLTGSIEQPINKELDIKRRYFPSKKENGNSHLVY